MTSKKQGNGKRDRMNRQNRRQPDRDRYPLPGDSMEYTRPRIQAARKPLEPQTKAQARYINAIDVYDLIFCKGPAGTGKTYVATWLAADMLANKEIEKIIITRPMVTAGEDPGFLPGDLGEKYDPYLKPVRAILEQRLGAGAVEYMLESGTIEIAPLAFLRGNTFENAFVIFDEAQNATVNQMKLFLTRIGENVKVIVDGDPLDQQDEIKGPPGFNDAWDRMEGHPQCGFIEFDEDDIVRSGLCRDILIRYRKPKGATVGQAELRNHLGAGPN